MSPKLISAILRRGGYRCAWCARKVGTGRVADQPVVCQIDVPENDESFVASCAACNLEFRRWWPDLVFYSVENARRFLGRHDSAVLSGPFVDYLIGATDDVAAFDTALARVEAQRNAPLDLVREKGRAA